MLSVMYHRFTIAPALCVQVCVCVSTCSVKIVAALLQIANCCMANRLDKSRDSASPSRASGRLAVVLSGSDRGRPIGREYDNHDCVLIGVRARAYPVSSIGALQKRLLLKELWMFYIIQGEFYEAYHLYKDEIQSVSAFEHGSGIKTLS